MLLHPGQQFAHFIIQRLIGAGAMGEVYEAVDQQLGRTDAVKLITAEFAHAEGYRVRLAEEARLAARIDSPFVVKIWEHGTFENQPYIAMECISGNDLRRATAAFSFNQKLDVFNQIGEGLRAAHQAGLIHRDLKPENIWLTSGGQVKILDFGLAKSVDASVVDREGNIEGTLSYISPEQLIGEPLTNACDLFSLGVVLYEMFVGALPFDGEHAASVAYSILHEDPTPPCLANPSLAPWLDPLIMTLLAKAPQDRFKSIGEAIDFVSASRVGRKPVLGPGYMQPKLRVTVIDLKNLSNDTEWDYFCQGFTEEVIREISRRCNLTVSAEPSTAAPRNVSEAFAKYRSDFIITGNLMRWQNDIRLQLNAHSQEQEKPLFSESYQGPSSDLFSLLARAAQDVARALADATGILQTVAIEAASIDALAFDFYLKGKAYYQTNRSEDLLFAAKLFQRAIDIQPDFALAHAGLSDVYAFQYMAYYDRTTGRIAAAHDEAARAIEIDPLLPDAHRSLGRYFMFVGDYDAAKRCCLRSTECDPKYALGYRTLGWLYRSMGQYSDAIDWAQKALERAPTDLETLLLLGLINMDQRRFTPAIAILHRAIELGPDYGRAYYYLGIIYLKVGALDSAIQNLSLSIKYKGDPNCYIDTGYAYTLKGDYHAARQVLTESIESGYMVFVACYYLGLVATLDHQTDEAGDHFRKGLYYIENLKIAEASDIQVEAYRALCLAGLEQHQEAASIIDQIYPQATNNGEVLYNVARVMAWLGKWDDAQRVAREAVASHAGPTAREIKMDPHLTLFASLRRP